MDDLEQTHHIQIHYSDVVEPEPNPASDHAVDKSLIELETVDFNQLYVNSNSPMASNCNSDNEDDIIPISSYPLEITDNIASASQLIRRGSRYKKFTHKDIEDTIAKYYDNTTKYLSEMDVLITYLKGMKMKHIHSKNLLQTKHYALSIATVGIVLCISIISPFIVEHQGGVYFISAGNAFATALFLITRYFNFGTTAELHSLMAHSYNNLETRIEFLENTSDSNTIYRDAETKLCEIRELYQVLIPEEIIYLFPIIHHTNIFRMFKKMNSYRQNLIVQLCDIKNEIHYIMYRWNATTVHFGEGEEGGCREGNCEEALKNPQHVREKKRLLYLMDLKEKIKNDLIRHKSTYNQMDDLFSKEMRYAETHRSCFGCSGWFKPEYDLERMNPAVRDYLKLLIMD